MLSLFLEPANLPFSVALVVMLGIGLLEGVATMLGAGLSQVLDTAVDAQLDVADHGLHPDVETPGLVGRFLDWLHIGRVPLLAVIVVFLMCFGLTGLLLQAVLHSVMGWMLPAWLAALGVFFAVLPVVRGLVGVLGRVMPKDETTAVARASFVGRIAVVTTGRAEPGQPAPAKLRDQHGQTHYVLVEPEDGQQGPFETGCEVILISQSGAVFRAIRNTHPDLVGTGQAP